MRHGLITAAATLIALGGTARLDAQQPTVSPSSAAKDSVTRLVDSARATPAGKALPGIDHFAWGDLSIPAGATVEGPVAAAHGNVNVRGQVNGSVFTAGGDIVVHQGGNVAGSALALQGKVILDGGRVQGEMRSSTPLAAGANAPAPLTGQAAVRHMLKITAGWFVVVLLVGLGVVIFSGAQLESVVQALENRFGAAFLVGIAAQVGLIPLLVILCLALTLTIVGILLIPFAIVAYILGAVGLVTLGGLAAATVAGNAIVRQGPNVRSRAVQSLVLGTTLLVLPWVAAALLANSPWGEMLARLAAIAITWVAATAGFGAALLARGGVRRVHVHVGTAEVSPASWQTPTPIGGVVAARRPSATPTGAPR